jgi:hypothetical protein
MTHLNNITTEAAIVTNSSIKKINYDYEWHHRIAEEWINYFFIKDNIFSEVECNWMEAPQDYEDFKDIIEYDEDGSYEPIKYISEFIFVIKDDEDEEIWVYWDDDEGGIYPLARNHIRRMDVPAKLGKKLYDIDIRLKRHINWMETNNLKLVKST